MTLQAPWIGVDQDGNIGLDWRHEHRRLCLTFTAEDVEFLAVEGPMTEATEATQKEGVLSDIHRLRRFVRWLGGLGTLEEVDE